MNVIQTGRAGAERLAVARMGVGLAGLVAPRTFGRLWVGAEGGSSSVAMITRAFAVRDFALGLGAYVAIRRNAPLRGWIEAGLLSDATDTCASLVGPAPGPRKVMLAGAAMVAVVGGALSLRGLEPSGSGAPTNPQ